MIYTNVLYFEHERVRDITFEGLRTTFSSRAIQMADFVAIDLGNGRVHVFKNRYNGWNGEMYKETFELILSFYFNYSFTSLKE